MFTIRVHDEQLARQLEEIAEREQRPVEEVLKTMVAQYPLNAPTEEADSRHNYAAQHIRRKAYAKARAYWVQMGDTEKASMSDARLDEEFAVFDQKGIPRLKSELASFEPPVGSLAYAAKIIREMGGVATEATLDVTKADEVLHDEFATYLNDQARHD